MPSGKVAGQQASRQQRVQELGLGGGGWTVGKKGIGAMRGRESRQPGVSAASLSKVPSEELVRHSACKECGSAGRQAGNKTWGGERA